MRARRLIVLIVSGWLVVACGGQGASPTPSPSSTATASPTPTATPPPTATATAPSSASPAPSPTPAAGFVCDLPYTRPSTAAEVPLTTVRIGAHAGYDRVVWEFAGSVLPEVLIEQVQPPFTKDPSDLPLNVSGSVFMRVRLQYLATAYDGPQDLKAGYPVLSEVAMQGHFEGVGTWIVGLTRSACYHVTVLTGPTRLVLDLR